MQSNKSLTCFVHLVDAVEVVYISEQHSRLHHWNQRVPLSDFYNISIKHLSRSWVSGYHDGAELSPLEWSQPAALRISPMLMRAWGMRGADQYFISPFMFIFSLCVLFRSVDLTAQKKVWKNTFIYFFCFNPGLQLFSFSY